MRRRTFLPILCTLPALLAATRPADLAFRITQIDPGYNETAALADINHDGKLDIISGDSWYEAPTWTKHHLRDIDYANGYIDNFSDLPLDVDNDGYPDVIQCSYFAHKIIWLKNPGAHGAPNKPWAENVIDDAGPTEFAFLVDLNNDGKAQEILPEYDRPSIPLSWYELDSAHPGHWLKHTVSDHSYGHGIGVGDVNGDGRNDILTPQGWLEAPADPRAPGNWTFHPTDWDQHPIPAAGHHEPEPASTLQPAVAHLAQPHHSSFGRIYLLDLNGDGRPDILTTMAHDYGIFWLENLGPQGSNEPHWAQHIIDNTWSQSHAAILADINGDGQPDFITGKRYFAHNGNDPGEREPIGLYWYEYRRIPRTPATATDPGNGGLEWIRHIVDYGNRMGGGMQIVAADLNGDGTLDLVSGGKAGLYMAENLSKPTPKE